jgi:tRNA 2-thiocytidine biosynthesis protein TtcA
MKHQISGKKIFQKIAKLVGNSIEKYNLIEEGDRILVGLSGGKDSWALMHVLHYLKYKAPIEFTFKGITFDPGFPNFGSDIINKYCQAHDWEHEIIKMNIPEIIDEKDFGHAPCVFCSRLRRGKLYGYAEEHNYNKLALGQHLDDVIISFFMSACRGQGIKTMAPLVKSEKLGIPSVIRPLALVPEDLLEKYADYMEFPISGHCAYEEVLVSGDRIYFKNMLNELTKKIPDIRTNIANSLGHVELKHLLIPMDDLSQKGE